MSKGGRKVGPVSYLKIRNSTGETGTENARKIRAFLKWPPDLPVELAQNFDREIKILLQGPSMIFEEGRKNSLTGKISP